MSHPNERRDCNYTMTLHTNILDDARRAFLPELELVRSRGFYLAGGTALALQIGHRDSVDFDFFTETPQVDTTELFEDLREHWHAHTLVRTQEERNTLGILVDDTIRVSFMAFPYPLLHPLLETEHLSLASLEDIGCMKLNAITGRSAYKDYVDLYYITSIVPLAQLLEALRTKMPELDPLTALKSLTYFDDLEEEPIRFVETSVTRAELERTLVKRVRALA